MLLNSKGRTPYFSWYYIPLILFLLVSAAFYTAILIFNDHHFIYTLDDPYIHLALAENILHGHYGVNLQENSAPSSSIIWPFLLAPFTMLGIGTIMPLLINILSSAVLLFIFWKLFQLFYISAGKADKKKSAMVILFLVFVVFATDMVSIAFSGMEHSLQMLAAVSILWGLIKYIQAGKVTALLCIAIIAAPLIRYENLVLSIAAILFLFYYRHFRTAVILFFSIVIPAAGFSIFLLNIGLTPLPVSIIAKQALVSSGGRFNSIFEIFIHNMFVPLSIALLLFALFLVYIIFQKSRPKADKLLSAALAVSIIIHMLMSSSGRYTAYLRAAAIFLFFYLNRDWLVKKIKETSLHKMVFVSLAVFVILFGRDIYLTFMLPVASNNIYEQQYQMHRFAVDYYRKPVAVNDLGYTSYQNNNYVLDLFGLASLEALRYRTSGDTLWMARVCREHNVKLAMIYDRWFHYIPRQWYKIAQMHLGKMKITPAESVVSFYITDISIAGEIADNLNTFKKSLPKDIKFYIAVPL